MDVTFVKDNKQKNPLLEKLKEIPSKIKNWQVPDVVYYFLILLVVGLGFYFVALYENGFSIQYGGDYSAQYIPMGFFHLVASQIIEAAAAWAMRGDLPLR